METRNSFQTLFIFSWQSLASIIQTIWELITFEVWCSEGHGHELVKQKGKVASIHTL